MAIHPTAVVDPKAELGADVSVGAYSVIGAGTRIADGVRIGPHVVVEGRTTIGAGTEILPFAVLGAPPGHLKDRGEETELVVGARCSVREHVSLHRGTNEGAGRTVIGDECAFFAHSHVGHDCVLERGVLLTNGAMLGGHVHIGEFAILGGNAGVHQFCRVGARAMVAGGVSTRLDVPPYCVAGHEGNLAGLNVVGLRRSGVTPETRRALQEAYRLVFRSDRPRPEALGEIRKRFAGLPEVVRFADFISESKRGVARHGREAGA